MLFLMKRPPRAIVPNAVPISTNMSCAKSRMRSHYQIGYNDYVMWYQSLIHLIIKGVMLMDNPLVHRMVATVILLVVVIWFHNPVNINNVNFEESTWDRYRSIV
jgi:hypothetical protein